MALFNRAFSMFNPFEALGKEAAEAEQEPRKAAGNKK
jgi:hypothetical protein